MEKERGHMTERMLNLTLEIIYLLTGENYIAYKLTDGIVTTKLRKSLQPVVEPISHSILPDSENDKKIQEVTTMMIELLAGEVPMKCQDVSVYLSKEEKGCLEGHKDLYKDIVMMENQPPLTSQDVSSNRNTPEKCQSPLYTQDSTQEDHKIHRDYQAEDMFDIKGKNMTEQDVPCTNVEESCKENEISPVISTDGPSESNAPERCASPLYSRESTRRHRKIRRRYPREDLVVIKVEDSDDNDESYVKSDEPSRKKETPPEIIPDPEKNLKDEEKIHIKDKDDESPPEISTDGQYMRDNTEKCPASYPDVEIEDDDVTTDSADDNAIASNFHPIINSADLSSDPSTHGGCFPDFSRPIIDPSASWGDVMAPCFDLNECFSQRAKLHARQKAQKGSESVSCSECGKTFAHKSNLITHERIHNSDRPYPCSICGKRFTQKSHLVTHKRIHTGEKPYSCPTCGKSFTDKSNLVAHQRTHTGLKPYSCPECGKSFGRRAYLLDHQRENKCERVWYFK